MMNSISNDIGSGDISEDTFELTKRVMETSSSWIASFVDKISNYSPVKQIIIGSTTGWCTGFITHKIGKVAALAAGGSIIILLVAQHNGYIRINWRQLNNDLSQAKHIFQQSASENKVMFKDVWKCIKQNAPFASGYLGGFLVGVATS